MKIDYQNLEKKIKIHFKNRNLLIKSLTHKSFDKEKNNEKIEFLGDRVLGLVISKKLLETYPDEKEDRLLLKALRDVNVPKFLKDDIPLFENIIVDLFPGIEKPTVDYGNLSSAITEACKHYNVQEAELFVTKIMQLYDTI